MLPLRHTLLQFVLDKLHDFFIAFRGAVDRDYLFVPASVLARVRTDYRRRHYIHVALGQLCRIEEKLEDLLQCVRVLKARLQDA